MSTLGVEKWVEFDQFFCVTLVRFFWCHPNFGKQSFNQYHISNCSVFLHLQIFAVCISSFSSQELDHHFLTGGSTQTCFFLSKSI